VGFGRVAAALSAIALLVAGLITLDLYSNPIPSLPGGQPRGAAEASTFTRKAETAAPSDVAVATPRIGVPGTLVFTKAGNL
jgi:hypothetical protein